MVTLTLLQMLHVHKLNDINILHCKLANNSVACFCFSHIHKTRCMHAYMCSVFSIKQVIKTFSKNVEGCRDGSAKNHRN